MVAGSRGMPADFDVRGRKTTFRFGVELGHLTGWPGVRSARVGALAGLAGAEGPPVGGGGGLQNLQKVVAHHGRPAEAGVDSDLLEAA